MTDRHSRPPIDRDAANLYALIDVVHRVFDRAHPNRFFDETGQPRDPGPRERTSDLADEEATEAEDDVARWESEGGHGHHPGGARRPG